MTVGTFVLVAQVGYWCDGLLRGAVLHCSSMRILSNTLGFTLGECLLFYVVVVKLLIASASCCNAAVCAAVSGLAVFSRRHRDGAGSHAAGGTAAAG